MLPIFILSVIGDFFRLIIPDTFIRLNFNVILYFLVFIVFVYIIYKFLKLTFRLGLVFVSGGLFPVLANYVLGLPIEVTVNTVFSYALMALVFYLLFILIGAGFRVLKTLSWPLRKIFGSSKSDKKEIEKEILEEIEEDEE